MTVRYEVSEGVATITLASPETRNVLNPATMTALAEHLAAAADDDAARVVVLTGDGTVFCAGADLAGATASDDGSFAGTGPQALVAVLEAMLDHPKPLIARVQGHVAGGGNGLVAAADLAVAAESARFAFSEVRVGVSPAVISVVCLAKLHPADARELLLTGERVSAQRMLDAGMLNAVVPDDALDAAVAAYVGALRQGGPIAVARTKELLRRVPAMPRDDAFAFAAELSGSLFASDEAREGMTAFLERRRPSWAPRA
ncbi:MAG TPA: enoyl-CoA hydratase-related protein [Candidatus Nanopelagicales bacterium]|nr:enoyl-CoA hydratase-related protein [Candidatus Nanopelagicales bacterium]